MSAAVTATTRRTAARAACDGRKSRRCVGKQGIGRREQRVVDHGDRLQRRRLGVGCRARAAPASGRAARTDHAAADARRQRALHVAVEGRRDGRAGRAAQPNVRRRSKQLRDAQLRQSAARCGTRVTRAGVDVKSTRPAEELTTPVMVSVTGRPLINPSVGQSPVPLPSGTRQPLTL